MQASKKLRTVAAVLAMVFLFASTAAAATPGKVKVVGGGMESVAQGDIWKSKCHS